LWLLWQALLLSSSGNSVSPLHHPQANPVKAPVRADNLSTIFLYPPTALSSAYLSLRGSSPAAKEDNRPKTGQEMIRRAPTIYVNGETAAS